MPMMDTQTVLWAIPAVLIVFALLAKFLVHRSKPLAHPHSDSSGSDVPADKK
jgi:cytochrome c-type biogenesis protein CcmH/NrfF